ncbi:putative Protein-tyrosine-phosphatase [uncultured Microbacterium sp.]|uniref:Phosphotyrosine protein phosphatase I domain-containing protein n=2 Tax=uncultured Microbacterium sp. TaxID=191216 RepID=A0A1Y5NXQ0_9MICO|nr:putative Protein-tyrosine-phosphatase [uncultured Microbacterium sp.]
MLLVCAANVCRSPLMEYVLSQAAIQAEADPAWSVISRGLEVTRAESLCAIVSELVATTERGRSFAAEHRPVLLEGDLLDGQDLIISASGRERSAIARLRPDLRDRSFTLKEAVRLGRGQFNDEEMLRAAERAPGPTGLATYAAALHERRGRVDFGRPRPTFRRSVPQLDPIDIPDVHDQKRRVHLRTLKEVQAVAGDLGLQLSGFLGGSGISRRRGH